MGKIVQFFKNRGMVGKMSWAISLILIIPITVICLFYYSAYQNSLIKDAKKRLSENLISVDNAMNTNLDTVETVIEGLEYRQEFNYFLDGKNNLSETEINYYVSSVQNEMLDIRRIYPHYFYQIIIHSSNSQAQKKDLAKDWQVELESVEKTDYYQEIEKIEIKGIPGSGNIYSSSGVAYGQVREAGFAMSEKTRQKLKAKEIIEVGTPVLPAYKKIYNITSKEFVGLIEVDVEVSKLICPLHQYPRMFQVSQL